MVQESTAVENILARMREIISHEPLPADLRTPAEFDVANSGALAAEVASPTSSVAPHIRAHEPSGLQSALSSDVMEAVFASAVSEGVSSSGERWVNRHQAELIDALGPIIRCWMDEQLPNLVQTVLIEELKRARTQEPAAHTLSSASGCKWMVESSPPPAKM